MKSMLTIRRAFFILFQNYAFLISAAHSIQGLEGFKMFSVRKMLNNHRGKSIQ